jgi:hypothetical protein
MITLPPPCCCQISRPQDSLKILSIEFFISKLIDTLVQQNSEAVSVKLLWHLIGIGDLELPYSHVITGYESFNFF